MTQKLPLLVALLLLVAIASVQAAPRAKRILVVLSNAKTIPGTTMKTGVWGEELVVPQAIFRAAGFRIDLASPKGGAFVFDPRSLDPAAVPDRAMRIKVLRYKIRHARAMGRTLRLAAVDGDAYDALFVPGGHGVMFDVATDPALARLTARFLAAGKVVASVCHGPCFLAKAKGSRGRYAIEGYRVTGFTDVEERAVKMEDHMPFSLEQGLKRASGGRFVAGKPWGSFVVTDLNLVSGQNPASSEGVAHAVVKLLQPAAQAVMLEAFIERRMKAAPRRAWGRWPGKALRAGILYDASPRSTDWSDAHVVVYFGRRKAGYPRARFLRHLTRHVNQGRRDMGPYGCSGYAVYAGKDFEMAYLRWPSADAATKAYGSPKGKALIADASSFMEGALFKKVRAYPKWLAR